MGLKGLAGRLVMGLTGLTGLTGLMGLMGLRGLMGLKGLAGRLVMGLTGLMGLMGLTGPRGLMVRETPNKVRAKPRVPRRRALLQGRALPQRSHDVEWPRPLPLLPGRCWRVQPWSLGLSGLS